MPESGFASGTAEDGRDDLVCEPGDEVQAGASGGSDEGTMVLNGVRLVLLDASGPILHLIGKMPCAPLLQAGPAPAATRDRIALRTASPAVPHAA